MSLTMKSTLALALIAGLLGTASAEFTKASTALSAFCVNQDTDYCAVNWSWNGWENTVWGPTVGSFQGSWEWFVSDGVRTWGEKCAGEMQGAIYVSRSCWYTARTPPPPGPVTFYLITEGSGVIEADISSP